MIDPSTALPARAADASLTSPDASSDASPDASPETQGELAPDDAAAPGVPPAGRDIVVVGASSGGVKALKLFVAALPASYRGSIFIVMHTAPHSQSLLAGILARAGKLRVMKAQDAAPIEPGCIYVAPADYHLLVEPGAVSVIHGPRENRHRPAIDPLFRSAAWAYGPRVIGVVLTGQLDDGTAGLWAVKSCGGVTVVQEPAEAEYPEMPSNALTHNRIDHRLPIEGIVDLLCTLVDEPPGSAPPPPPLVKYEVEAVKFHSDVERARQLGAVSPFTCPSCGGALWELEESGHLRYRCHTGHAFTMPTLMVDQTEAVESSLYAALRALEEKSHALRRLAERWPEGLPDVKEDYERRATELDDSAEVIRSMLATGAAPV